MPVSVRLLKVAGIAALAIGILGLIARVSPPVSGQTARRAAAFELKGEWGLFSLGASLRDVDDADVRRESLKSASGAVVEDVRADGPAAKAGLRAGDIITTFDGERVRSARHLMRLAEETPEGRDVAATALRAGKPVELKIAPQTTSSFFTSFEPLRRELRGFTLPDSFVQMSPRLNRDWTYEYSPSSLTRAGRRLGMEIQNVSGQLAEYFGTSTGVLVTSVDAGSAAATAGVKAGDVITAVGSASVRDTDDLRRRLDEAAPDTTMTIVRDRKQTTLKLQFKDEPVEAETPRKIVR